jgi:hypothetical protein
MVSASIITFCTITSPSSGWVQYQFVIYNKQSSYYPIRLTIPSQLCVQICLKKQRFTIFDVFSFMNRAYQTPNLAPQAIVFGLGLGVNLLCETGIFHSFRAQNGHGVPQK